MLNNSSRFFLSTLLMGSITSCANIDNISTNLDKENFDNYFAPSKVKILSSESELDSNSRLLGIVEGEDCQAKAHFAEPDEINARTQARGKAYELGANAIIFTGCANIIPENNKQCVAIKLCYGKAYLVESLKAEAN